MAHFFCGAFAIPTASCAHEFVFAIAFDGFGVSEVGVEIAHDKQGSVSACRHHRNLSRLIRGQCALQLFFMGFLPLFAASDVLLRE